MGAAGAVHFAQVVVDVVDIKVVAAVRRVNAGVDHDAPVDETLVRVDAAADKLAAASAGPVAHPLRRRVDARAVKVVT